MSISLGVSTLSAASSVFYPLPVQGQGNFLAAKNLYLGEGGGLWIHDVHGKVMFYDGGTLLPRKGSLLEFSSDEVAFLNDEFWTYFDNEVYRHVPGIESFLAFSLSPGAEIRNIGASGDYIWVTDRNNFYTYNTLTSEFETYSLLKLYRHNKRSDIRINDAERVLSKWVLATSAGVYRSEEKEFEHITASGKFYIEAVYFSDARRELLVGTRNGLVIINLSSPDVVNRIPGSHVLSLAETSDQYWIGTEHGLMSYNFITGKITRFQGSDNQDFSLPGEKIYSLVNDSAGGLWIATNNGIRYFSLYSSTFQRTSISGLGMHSVRFSVNKLLSISESEFWVATSEGLYVARTDVGELPKRIYSEPVSDIVAHQGLVYLATPTGLIAVDQHSRQITSLNLPRSLRQRQVDTLALNTQGLLWLTSEQNLYSLDIATNKATSYGMDWLVSKYLPAKITDLSVDKQGEVYIGTDHGFYSLVDGRISFKRDSLRFGKVVDIAHSNDGSHWFAGSYGVYRIAKGSEYLEDVELVEDNISPVCLVSDKHGIWLGSSKGISFYGLSGILNKHIGSPFGLILNEFAPGACSLSVADPLQSGLLVMGSKYGLVGAMSNELLVSDTPQRHALVSKVTVDQNTVALGGKYIESLQVPYGSSLSFKFGVLPVGFVQAMEYRLNEGEPWIEFEGGLLALEHILPGDYVLEVKPVKDSHYRFVSTKQPFTILEPWYLSNWAAASFMVLLIGFVTVLVFWRSRFVTFANRKLKAQVALKTDQLRHQSRILLATNQQLKKQLAVKNVLVTHTAGGLVEEVNRAAALIPNWQESDEASPIVELRQGLEQLAQGHENGQTTYYDLVLVLESVLTAWKDDLAKAGIELEVNLNTKHRYITLNYFNLDIVFNSLVASAIKRNFKSQRMLVSVEEVKQQLVVTLRDFGMPFPKWTAADPDAGLAQSTDLNIEKLPLLIHQSGGELKTFISDSQNVVQLSWLIEYQVSQKITESTLEQIETIKHPVLTQEQQKLSAEQEWKNRVALLVSEHYSDAEFGTASVARLLYMSERSLQRRFKSAFDKTFKEYLNQVRLEHACERLLAGEKVSDVAFNSGFNDPSYFSQRFKHHFGMSPSKFAENSDD